MLMSGNKRLRQLGAIAENANWLLVKLALKNPRLAYRYFGEAFRTYARHVRDGQWKSRSIFELLAEFGLEPKPIILEPVAGEGLTDAIDELAYLALLTQAMNPRLVFEIGTYRGRTALNFALNSPPDCRVITLDLPVGPIPTSAPSGTADSRIAQERQPGAAYVRSSVGSKVTQLYGDSRTFDFSQYERAADLVLVDGGHDYATALCDSRTALRLVRNGGLIAWHDFANYGDYHDVTRAVRDSVGLDRVWQIDDSELAIYQYVVCDTGE